MIHQYDVWAYLHKRYKSTDMVAKEFELTMEQALHTLQKLVKYGHAKKERRGIYSYWKAIEDCPPRNNAFEKDRKRERELDVFAQMVFEDVVYRAQLCEKTGLSEWVVQKCLQSLEKQGEIQKVGTKGWTVIKREVEEKKP